MLEIAQSVDKYVMQERLGQSSKAEVWRAFDQALQRPVIIKFLHISQQKHAHSIQRLRQNFSMLVSLRHPNIIQIYDISSHAHISGQIEGSSAYVVMPDIARVTLADYSQHAIKEGKQPSALEIAQLFVAVGSALDYAHRRGVIHSHIKPSNILLDQQNTTFLAGEPVLTDFGLMALENPANAKARSSLYTAPEQGLGGAVTEQCDIYALGVILYELYTGKHPFEDLGQGSEQHLLKAMLDPIAPSRVNPAISPTLEAVILQSIAREPEERFANVHTMVLALLQALNVPLSPSLCMEYHISFIELLQKQAEEVRDNIMVSEIIDPQKLFTQDAVGRASLYGGPSASLYGDSPPTINSPITHEPITASPAPHSPIMKPGEEGREDERDNEGRRDYEGRRDHEGRREVIGTGPPQGRARPTMHRLYEYRFIPLSIIPLLLIASTLLGSLGAGQVARPVGGVTAGQVIGGVPTGTMRFLSSGQGDTLQGQGINDEVNVDLIHVNAPGPQKSYYVWLQADVSISDSGPLLLGQLNVSQGSANFIYKDPRHTDLLATWSRILITEEDATIQPIIPSLEATQQVAFGEIPQEPTPGDQKHYTGLDHLRHLLASDPDLNALHLPGGLSVWMMDSMQRMQGHVQRAEDSLSAKDGLGLHNQLMLLLSDIDGAKGLAQDVPHNMPFLDDGPSTQVGLLQIRANQDPPSYLYHIGTHVLGLAKAPGVTPEQRNIANTIVPVIDTVNNLLQEIRSTVTPLVTLSPQQLLQPQVGSQLASITYMVNTAYQGQGNIQGVSWMSAQLASLAVIPIHT